MTEAAAFIVKKREFLGINKAYSPKRRQSFDPWRTLASFPTLELAQADYDRREVGIDQVAIFHRGKIVMRKPE